MCEQKNKADVSEDGELCKDGSKSETDPWAIYNFRDHIDFLSISN